ncbi:hypothetical protein FZC35_02065 [Candidatus Cytomitobacter indipagum]|uniref:Leucine-rich repeat domain-containing protein n=1 Tax=Candidatus Cytomitobacter indipagum TaxID=2601575 RepID=A0A5C0UEM4_9PROT|nr:hypothetical protein [Candidatus Cytomitobacter indipagum]QEK38150.1 hypothetical protein FZC35_02065 [Candidatus Cytomitobacter indipagum]
MNLLKTLLLFPIIIFCGLEENGYLETKDVLEENSSRPSYLAQTDKALFDRAMHDFEIYRKHSTKQINNFISFIKHSKIFLLYLRKTKLLPVDLVDHVIMPFMIGENSQLFDLKYPSALKQLCSINTQCIANILTGKYEINRNDFFVKRYFSTYVEKIIHEMEMETTLDLTKSLNKCNKMVENFLDPYKNIKKLDLSGNQIYIMSKFAFSKLTKLKELIISDNCIISIPNESFYGMHNLEKLILSNNKPTKKKIFYGNKLLGNKSKIIQLHLKSFVNLINLKILHLTNNAMHLLPNIPLFANFSNLQELNLSGNKFTSIGDQIFSDNLNSLAILDLSNNELDELDENAFLNLHGLQKLSLKNNKLTFIHENTFRKLTKLETLELSNNALYNTLCDNLFANLINLQSLDISSCNISILKNCHFLKKCTKLQSLNLNNNGIPCIDQYYFCDLPNLEVLKLNHNRIMAFPYEALNKLQKLQKIDLSYNNRFALRRKLTLYNLTSLKIRNNDLETFNWVEIVMLLV